jgi:hypothetical protein
MNDTLDLVRRDRAFRPVFVINWLVGREATIDQESSCELHAAATVRLQARNGDMAVLQVSERNKSSQRSRRLLGNSGGHFEEVVDEPPLSHHLALPNYVHRLIALNRSLRSLEFAKPLLGVHSAFDRTMVLLDDSIAPLAVLLCHANNQGLSLSDDTRLSRPALTAAVIFLSDQFPMPALV